MDKDQLKQCFGPMLRILALGNAQSFACSPRTIDLLTTVGMPSYEPLLITAYKSPEIIEHEDGKRYLLVGTDYSTSLCIQEFTDVLFAIDMSGDLPSRFVNSTIWDFLDCLCIYSTQREPLAAACEDDAINICSNLEAQFRAVDPYVFRNEENWWSVILEQTKAGLM